MNRRTGLDTISTLRGLRDNLSRRGSRQIAFSIQRKLALSKLSHQRRVLERYKVLFYRLWLVIASDVFRLRLNVVVPHMRGCVPLFTRPTPYLQRARQIGPRQPVPKSIHRQSQYRQPSSTATISSQTWSLKLNSCITYCFTPWTKQRIQ